MANKKNTKSAKVEETPSIASQPTSKKIGFFSAMLIVMGSSIGAGIFFKAKGVLESSQGSLIFAILAWLIAAFAVISMALALVEIASARNDNLSLIGWCKVFNSRTIYKASKNFMFYIYLPLTYFFMPFYVIMSIQDAIVGFGGPTDIFQVGDNAWLIWLVISLAISAFFIFVSGLSSKAGNIMNMGIMAVKFLPLLATIILGFVIAGMQGAVISGGPLGSTNDLGISSNVNSTEFGFMSPGIGLFMAMGAIFFAYDGFYVTAGIQSEMREPKKTPLAIVFGLGAVTIIYLLIAVSMSITGNGGLFGFTDFLDAHNVSWIFGLLNLTIAIGVLGIINGFSMWAPRFVEDLIKDDEIPFGLRFKHKLNAHRPMVGVLYSLTISFPIVIIFTVIGALAYINNYGTDYDVMATTNSIAHMGKLYTFADLMGTWTAVFAFMFIMLPIYGGLKNRKTNLIATEQKKYFVWSGWVSVIIIGLVLLFLFVDAFVNVFMLINLSLDGWRNAVAAQEFYLTSDLAADPNAAPLFTIAIDKLTPEVLEKIAAANGVDVSLLTNMPISNYDYLIGGDDGLIGRVMKLVMLFVFIGLMLLPTVIEDQVRIHKYGSLANYENALGLASTAKLNISK